MKNKKLWIKCLVMISLVCTILCGSFAMKSADVLATNGSIAESGFEMTEGAGVRLHATELGIRWETTVTETFYNSLNPNEKTVTFHTLVGPATDALKEDITVLSLAYATENDFYDFECTSKPVFTDEDNNPETAKTFTYYGAIYYDKNDLIIGGVDRTLEAASIELIARAYVSVDTDVIYAITNDTARSMLGVASYCLENDLHTDYNLNQYVGDSDGAVEALNESKTGYFDSSKNAGSALVATLADGKYTAFVGAKKVGEIEKSSENTEIAFSQLPNLVGGEALEDGEDYSLRLVDANGEIFATSFKKATKTIKTQAELQSIFKITSYETVTGKDVYGGDVDVLKINEFDGYYLLIDDIKAEAGSVHRVLPGDYIFKAPYDGFSGNYGTDTPIKLNFGANNADAIARAKAEILPKDFIFNKNTTDQASVEIDVLRYHQGGLTGTFDGNGHTIEDLYIYGPGIFGIIDGGTVKNVAFKNVKFTGAYGVSKATLAYSMANATLENVYIQTEALTVESWAKDYGKYVTAYVNDAFTSRALVAMSAVGTINMNNCVFVCPEIEATQVTYMYSYGSLFAQAHAFQSFKNTSSVENVYVVSPYALGAKSNNKSNTLYWYDSNVSREATKYEIATQYGVTFNSNAVIYYPPENLKRYDDLLKMQEAANSYTSFTESVYWSLDGTTGLPVWGKANA